MQVSPNSMPGGSTRGRPPIDASGLEIELRCPRCPQAALVDMQNDAAESRCTSCAGSHIATKGMKKIFVEHGGVAWRTIESISGKSRPGATRCPSCHAHTAALAIGQTNADVCPKCLSAWFARGALFLVTNGKYGSRTSPSVEAFMPGGSARRGPAINEHSHHRAPAVYRKQRSNWKSVFVITLPLLALGSAGSAYWWLVQGGAATFASKDQAVVEERKTVALVPNEPAPAMIDYPFGGLIPADWARRLTVLKARNDDRGRALYELTKKRAVINGLTVEDGGTEVIVRPSPDLMARIGERLAGTQIAAELSEPAIPKSVENKATSFRPSKKHPRIILAKRDTNEATIRIQFRAGAYDDAHRSGLTKLAQQAMLGANAEGDYQELMLDIFAAGATLQLETGVRESAFTLTAPAAEFERLAKKLATMCLSPRIVAAGMEDAKSRALTQAQETNLGALVSAIARTVFSEPGYQNDPDGDKETIRALTTAEVAKHVAGPMSPANATVVVAGKFDVKKFKTFLSKFSGGKSREVVRPKGELAGNYHLRSPFEVHLVAFPVSLRSARSVAAAHFAGALLQERIFHQFRKMGVVYTVSASPVHREWLDSVVLMLPLDSQEPIPAASLLNEEIEKMKSGGLEDATFERNRAFLLADFAELDRDPSRLAAELASGGGELEWIGPKVYEQVAKMSKSELLDELGEQLSPRASIHVHFSPKTGAAAERSAHR